MVMARTDVDSAAPERLEDALKLVLAHREVAVDDRYVIAAREGSPGVDPHRLA